MKIINLTIQNIKGKSIKKMIYFNQKNKKNNNNNNKILMMMIKLLIFSQESKELKN